VISTDRQYFVDMYASDLDPWRFATSWYERRKYAITVNALPREHYQSAFEPGCSIGVLSELLAPHCVRLLATDIVPAVVEVATRRLEHYSNVAVEQRAIPDCWPAEKFDLIVLSEIAYYFDAAMLESIMEQVIQSTDVGAHVLAVHWRGETDYPLTGDQVHGLIGSCKRLQSAAHFSEDNFVLDLWERTA
jgi:protein-L-isoaspartate O-methyltransferase